MSSNLISFSVGGGVVLVAMWVWGYFLDKQQKRAKAHQALAALRVGTERRSEQFPGL